MMHVPKQEAAESPVPLEKPTEIKPQLPTPVSTPTEATVKAQAKPAQDNSFSDDRQDILEKIMRHAGLGAEDVFGFDDSIPKPEFPINPPHLPKNPEMPPAPPSVEPGPPLEPEQKPPIQEPPLEPSPAPTAEGMNQEPSEEKAESASEEFAAILSKLGASDAPKKVEVEAGMTDEEPVEKTPAAIQESVVTPHETEGTSASFSVEKPDVSSETAAILPDINDSDALNETETIDEEPAEEASAAIQEPVVTPHETEETPAPFSVEKPDVSSETAAILPDINDSDALNETETIDEEPAEEAPAAIQEPVVTPHETEGTSASFSVEKPEVSSEAATILPDINDSDALNETEAIDEEPAEEASAAIQEPVVTPHETEGTSASFSVEKPEVSSEAATILPDINDSDALNETEAIDEEPAEEASAAIQEPVVTPHETEGTSASFSVEKPEVSSEAATIFPDINDGDAFSEAEIMDEEPAEKAPAAIREPVVTPHETEETPAPPAAKEPPQKEVPRYRAATLPLHVIELNVFDDALANEANDYGPPPIHAPEPIPFPVDREEKFPKPPLSQEKADNAPAPEAEETGKVRPIPLPERPQKTKKVKKRFRVFGNDEDPAPPDGPPKEQEDELEDFDAPADAPSVLNDLLSNVRTLFLRFAATCLFMLLSVGFAVAWEHATLLPGELHSLYTPKNCLIVELILLAASAVFCMPTILNGFRGLFCLQANSDSAVAVAVLAAAAQNVTFLFTGFPANCRLYSSLAILALFLDTAGKLSMSKRILRNFHFLTSPDEKYAVQMFDDYNTAIQMTKALAAGGPKIAYQTKVGFLSHFLKHSYASDPGEHVSQFLAPAGFLGSLGLCITAAVLTKNPVTALTVFTASACLCVPFGSSLSVNLPLARLNRIAARCGGMTVGWDAVEQFSGTDAVMINAQDLFPRGTVVLNGIQAFAGQRIDEAILDATALTAAVGGTLSDLFSQIVKARGEVLPQVEHPVYEDELGISGTVSDRIILVGRGELLKRHGVDAPSHDYEEKYLRTGKIPVYLASGGQLVAMFLVFYRSDRRRAAELRRLESNGISLLVRTRDPNITPELIADCFGLSRHSIAVLPERLGSVYASLQAHPPERVPAVLATKSRTTAMMRLLTACSRQKSNVSIGVALQTAGSALGFALAAFFTGCSALNQLSATTLLLFEAFWTAAVIFVPKIRKP